MSDKKRNALIAARNSKGYSRPKLAASVGVTFEHIKKLEYGDSNPSISLMFKICGVLEESPEVIFKDIVCS